VPGRIGSRDPMAWRSNSLAFGVAMEPAFVTCAWKSLEGNRVWPGPRDQPAYVRKEHLHSWEATPSSASTAASDAEPSLCQSPWSSPADSVWVLPATDFAMPIDSLLGAWSFTRCEEPCSSGLGLQAHSQRCAEPTLGNGAIIMDSAPCLGSADRLGLVATTSPSDGRAPELLKQVEKRVHTLLQQGVTTLMLRNVPESITQLDLLQKLRDSGFGDLFDFVHLPSSFDTHSHNGYGFVNLVSSEAAASLARAWDLSYVFGQDKEALNISAAALQGLDANVKKWSKKSQRIRNPALRPFVAQARDGRKRAA